MNACLFVGSDVLDSLPPTEALRVELQFSVLDDCDPMERARVRSLTDRIAQADCLDYFRRDLRDDGVAESA